MRKIKVSVDYLGNKSKLLSALSVQLSDGYWENEENFFTELWNWLEFETEKDILYIKVKKYPTWEGTKDIFSDMSDEAVVRYVGNALDTAYGEAPKVFNNRSIIYFDSFTDDFILNVIKELSNFGLDNIDYKSQCSVCSHKDVCKYSSKMTEYVSKQSLPPQIILMCKYFKEEEVV